MLVARRLTPLNAVEAAAWRSYAAGYCAVTIVQDQRSNCMAGASGAWMLSTKESASLQAAAHSCLRRCRACGRCRFISVSAKLSDCSWFHDCRRQDLNYYPREFMSVPVGPEAPGAPEPVAVPSRLPQIPHAWRHAGLQSIQEARRHELDVPEGVGLAAANASGWLAYLSRVYGATTLQLPSMWKTIGQLALGSRELTPAPGLQTASGTPVYQPAGPRWLRRSRATFFSTQVSLHALTPRVLLRAKQEGRKRQPAASLLRPR